MSIYSTIGSLYFATGRRRKRCDHKQDLHAGDRAWDNEFAEVYFQGVPGHIGHPEEGYATDPYTWLPPVRKDAEKFRAVVVCGPYTYKKGQQYFNALETISGEDWETISFGELWGLIETKLADHMKGGRYGDLYE